MIYALLTTLENLLYNNFTNERKEQKRNEK